MIANENTSQKNVANKRRADIKLRMARMLNNKCTISCICVHWKWWREREKMTEKILWEGWAARVASVERGLEVLRGGKRNGTCFWSCTTLWRLWTAQHNILCCMYPTEVSHVVACIAHGALLYVHITPYIPARGKDGDHEFSVAFFFSSLGTNASNNRSDMHECIKKTGI